MNEYFTPVDVELFPPSSLQQLTEHILLNPQEVRDHYHSKAGVKYGLSFVMGRENDIAKSVVDQLRKRCALNFMFSIKYVRPPYSG